LYTSSVLRLRIIDNIIICQISPDLERLIKTDPVEAFHFTHDVEALTIRYSKAPTLSSPFYYRSGVLLEIRLAPCSKGLLHTRVEESEAQAVRVANRIFRAITEWERNFCVSQDCSV